jgi:hypothetical protein
MTNSLLRSLFAPVSVIGAAHVFGGVAVIGAPQAALVSAMAGPMMTGIGEAWLAIILVGVGVAAIASRVSTVSNRTRLALTAPQQAILLIQFYGVCVAIWAGGYPDGYIPVPGNWLASAWFILGDQSALIAMCLSHTFEVTFLRALSHEEHLQLELKLERDEHAACKRYLNMLKETEFWEKTIWSK